MKYKIKGEKIVRQKFSVEIEAKSFYDAFVKTRKSMKGEVAIERINGEFIASETEAEWQDRNPLKDIFDNEYSKERLDTLRGVLLKSRPVKFISIDFSGQGDDGQVDYTSVEPPSCEEVLNELVGHRRVSDIVSDLTDYVLESIPVDWVNGNGGSGTLRISLGKDDKLNFYVSCHEWSHEEGFSFVKNICEP